MQALNAGSDGSDADLAMDIEICELDNKLGNAAPQAGPGHGGHAGPGHGATWIPNNPKKGTEAHWRFMREEPIFQGHHLSIKQLCYMLADWKQEGRVTDHAFNLLCSLVRKVVFRDEEDNMFPSSYHIVKAVLDVPPATSCVQHICDRCWSIFPSLRTDQHCSHVDEVCHTPGCGRQRFMKKANGKVVPRRRVWDFGIKSAVTDLLLLSNDILPTIVEARKASLQDKGSFWSSPAGPMLDARCKFKFSNPGPDEIAILLSLGAPTCCRRVPLSAPVHSAVAVDS